VFSTLDRAENRLIPFFQLNGVTEDGTIIHTDYATLTSFTPNFSPTDSTLAATASASELKFDYPLRDTPSPANLAAEYLSRAQRGFHPVSVATEVGTLIAGGSHGMDSYANEFGIIRIETPEQGVTEAWLAECDLLANRTLLLLSLAQVRWLNWTQRTIYVDGERSARQIRPRELNQAALAGLFSHLNLGPILNLLTGMDIKNVIAETGIDVALSWMLSPTPHLEKIYLSQMVALEHLISVFEPKARGLLDKTTFKGVVEPELAKIVDALAKEGSLDPSLAEPLKERISRANQPSFYEKILQIIEHYSVPVADIRGDLKFALVDCRNDLVHRGALNRIGDDFGKLYRNLHIAEEFLKRLILAILRYEGQYISALYNLESYVFGEGEVRPLNPK
jgi:hypothetical protein